MLSTSLRVSMPRLSTSSLSSSSLPRRPVYLTAVLKYLATEVLELVGNAVRDNKKNRIIPRHVLLAIRNGKELGSTI
uniref:Histone H2A n=1 Tax=Oryza brachyantha TaxID=4533 RepID=J3LWN8_ORYBR